MGKPALTWKQFSEVSVLRFIDSGLGNIFEQFAVQVKDINYIFEQFTVQVKDINSYYDEFEWYKGRLLEQIPILSEKFFTGNFIGGLDEETKRMVKLLDPQTFELAYKQAKSFETPLPNPSTLHTKSIVP